MLKLLLFGSPQIIRDGEPVHVRRRRGLALIIYLAVTQRPHSREALANLIWSEHDQKDAFANLRRELTRLRKDLGEGVIAADRKQIWLEETAVIWVDSLAFEHHLATNELGEAVALAIGDFLVGFSVPDALVFEDWVLFERERLQEQLSHALSQLILNTLSQAAATADAVTAAILYAKRWLDLDPFHEAAHRALMQLYALNNQRTAALNQYEKCVQLLAEELGVEPEEETTALHEAIRTRQFPPPETAKARTSENGITGSLSHTIPSTPTLNIPAQSTPFIGRENQLIEIRQLLRDEASCRLLTLVGPGGIGKTRLAIEAASDLLSTFPNGVYFVGLASVDTIDNITATIADSLRFQLQGAEDPKTQLARYLRPQQLLLLVDNLEHLIDGSNLLAELVQAAPHVKLLVTSREQLNLQEEWLYPVGGMNVPEEAAPLETLEENQAVQLFELCARRADASFAATDETLLTVAHICRLVDGMPLGIELAAAWVGTISCQEIIAEIEQGLDILTTAKRNVPKRHRSIRAIIEQTWAQLSSRERSVFSELSIFRGSCSREAAQQVTNATLPVLASLVGRALLRRTENGRYEIHELIRQFATEQLLTSSHDGEQTHAQLQARHCAYYASFLHARTADLMGSRQVGALAEVAADIDNIRAAWRRAIRMLREQKQEHPSDNRVYVEAIVQGLESLFQFYWIKGRFLEGQEAFNMAVQAFTIEADRSASSPNKALARTLVKLIARHGAFCSALGQHELATDVLQDGLARARALDASEEVALMLNYQAQILKVLGKGKIAQQRFRESLMISRQLGDKFGMADSLLGMGWVAADELGEYEEADQYYREGLELSREVGSPAQLAFGLDKFGFNLWKHGHYAEAKEPCQESLEIFRELNDRLGIANALGALAFIALTVGGAEAKAAMPLAEASVAACRGLGHQAELANRLNILSMVSSTLGEYHVAQRASQEALSISVDIHYDVGITQSTAYLGDAARGMGEYQQAKALFNHAYKRAQDGDKLHHMIDILVKIAALWIEESNQFATAPGADQASILQKRVSALQILLAAIHHPKTWQMFRDQAMPLIAQLEEQLSEEAINTAREMSHNYTLEKIVQSTDLTQ